MPSIKPARTPIFTPAPLVCRMCDLCEPVLSDYSRKVFEPGCGAGNFLVETLGRRLKCVDNASSALIALTNLYGVEIEPEYLTTARSRLRSLMSDRFPTADYRFLPLVDVILEANLIQSDLLKDRDKITFVDWQPVSDFEFRPTQIKFSELLPEDFYA